MLSILKPRQAKLTVMYEGVDISANVQELMTDFTYTERAKQGESDDISVSFENTQKLWSTGWLPERGAKIHVTIATENWHQRYDYQFLDCGQFEIDDFTDSGPPSRFSIGAVSVGITSSFRGETLNKAWENIRISEVVREFAEKHHFEFFFDSEYDPIIQRFDQTDESDLSFLVKIVEYAGLQVRISHGKIIVYQDFLYDQKEVSLTLTRNYDGYLNHSFRASSADIYSACHVQYFDSFLNKLITYQYFPDGQSGAMLSESDIQASTVKKRKPQPCIRWVDEETDNVITKSVPYEPIEAPNVGKILKINRRCSSLAEAEMLAKSCLRSKNQREITGSFSLVGHLSIRAGLLIAVEGFGRWDAGKYCIEEVSHSWSKSGGLTTNLSLRGTLEY